MKLILAIAASFLLLGCASDGSVDWNKVGKAAEKMGEYGRAEQARIDEINRSRNNSRSNQQVQNNQTMLFCNLVRTDRGRTTEGLSLNRGSNVPGNTEPTICTYECSDGSVKQTTTQYNCPSRP